MPISPNLAFKCTACMMKKQKTKTEAPYFLPSLLLAKKKGTHPHI